MSYRRTRVIVRRLTFGVLLPVLAILFSIQLTPVVARANQGMPSLERLFEVVSKAIKSKTPHPKSPKGTKNGVYECSGGVLPAGASPIQDLEVTGACIVNGQVNNGRYTYRNVNIYTPAGAKTGGSLIFQESRNSTIRFYAESIVVEAGGSLVAGSANNPIGSQRGTVEIHLWGAAKDAGPLCKSPPVAGQSSTTCGIPMAIWNSNPPGPMYPSSCNSTKLSNGVTDCFYQYQTFDPVDVAGAYFGHKVLALSYGGTLQLFGKKGATICDPNDPNSAQCMADADPSNTGTSWVRLNASIAPGATQLTLDRPVDWETGDQVVVTTTDYLAAHSERVTIASVQGNNVTLSPKTPIQYPHSGVAYSLASHNVPAGKGPDTSTIETRAAVALLTRSIRIVSEGDTPVQSFDYKPGYYFGGHTIARQGFETFQVQGVEFKELGQGGSKAHYPVHFHMVRQAPANTFAKDNSVNESMTRWYVIHASSEILLARNVGYRSIGHGYYLEDGTETDNKLYSNIGIFARSATANAENPRNVPGILVAPDWPLSTSSQPGYVNGFETVNNSYSVAAYADATNPTVFWIMNGWNDFQYNMAAGAGACGSCYWLVPGATSGPSMFENWTGYAGEQGCAAGTTCTNPTDGRAGYTPLKEFYHNSCVAAATAFQNVGGENACVGVERNASATEPFVAPIISPSAPTPASTAGAFYYPVTSDNRFPTTCSGNGCLSVEECGGNNLANCAVTVLDHFTTSFNAAEKNFSAVWLRTNWFLVTNSAITDVLQGGLTFVTGGGYTDSDAPLGYWGLARQTAFVGNTQPCSLSKNGTCANPFASNAGPFNPNTLLWTKPNKQPDPLDCAKITGGGYPANVCLDPKHDLTLQFTNFGLGQRLFNIYDGPSYQDSNVYLDINPTPLDCSADGSATSCGSSGFMYARAYGVPAAQIGTSSLSQNQCYLPNAAIAWKQPNGFFYPPAFHSSNLYFDNVDIRHFVIEPLFDPNSPISFTTDQQAVNSAYCTGAGGLFTGFTDVDRQTVLLDDDGTLTGLVGTTSVNDDPFFNAPTQTAECGSNTDIPPLAALTDGATAKTSPYEYVSTVLYPHCALSGSCTAWDQVCSNPSCYGVPLYRELLTPTETAKSPLSIRLMGQATYQRSSLTVNNGRFYVDTTVDSATQSQTGGEFSVFGPGQTFYVFDLFARPDTVQTFDIYVGQDFDEKTVHAVQVDPTSAPYTVNPVSNMPSTWQTSFDAKTGILTVKMDMSFSAFGTNYTSKLGQQCQPASFCAPSNGVCACTLQDSKTDPYQHGLFQQCQPDHPGGQSPICKYAQADVKCPAGGCYGFEFTLPSGFSNKTSVPPPIAQCIQTGMGFDAPFSPASQPLAGQCFYSSAPKGQFCQ